MANLNEEILEAWLRLTTVISNERLVSDMPYNEALICFLLYNNRITNPCIPLTATDLCRETGMLKSQMNRTLSSMENKGLIVRVRSEADKRQIHIFLSKSSDAFQLQHQKSLKLIDALIEKAGEEKAKEIGKNFTLIANLAKEVIK